MYVCMYARLLWLLYAACAMIVWDYSTHKPGIIRSCIFISLLGRELGPQNLLLTLTLFFCHHFDIYIFNLEQVIGYPMSYQSIEFPIFFEKWAFKCCGVYNLSTFFFCQGSIGRVHAKIPNGINWGRSSGAVVFQTNKSAVVKKNIYCELVKIFLLMQMVYFL